MSNQTFTEEEIIQIIKKAAQFESDQHQNLESIRPGLTMEELITATSEAGLDPENVRIAAKEIREGPKTEDRPVRSDFRSQVFAERWIDGKLSDELADSVIADLKHRYDASEAERSWYEEWHDENWDERFGTSNVQKTGRSIEWKHIDQYGVLETRVLMQPRGKQIRVRVTKRNLWDSVDDGPGNEIYEYMAAVPLVAGFVIFFTLPYGFWVNMLLALIAYICLELVAPTVIERIKLKWGQTLSRRQKPGIEEKKNSYKQEVEQLANEISQILTTDLDESMMKDPKLIEMTHVKNHLRKKE